jgi:CRISPR-associated protein Cmr1
MRRCTLARQNLEVTLETVTPMFLAGADGKTPELRPASFRGAMRFWLRALLGGVLGDNAERVRQEEARTFGSTEGASPMVIQRVKDELGEPRRLNIKASQKPGLFYMLWSIERLGREAFAPGRKFTLSLRTRPGQSGGEGPTVWTAASLWLLVHLGGLGARTRRGGGGLRVPEDPTNWQGPSLVVQATTPKELATELSDKLSEWLPVLNCSFASHLESPTSFDILHRQACETWVLADDESGWPSWEEALDVVGSRLQKFRERSPAADYRGVKDVVLGHGPPSAVERAAFGLPQPYFYSSLYKQYLGDGEPKNKARDKASATVGPADRDIDRRASPLFFHITRLANGRYTVVVTLFNAIFLPEEAEIAIRPKDRSKRTVYCSAPNYGQIQTFLDTLKKWEVAI